ncbi:hypothetical protein Tco_1501897 [Tanacetum coccineum]
MPLTDINKAITEAEVIWAEQTNIMQWRASPSYNSQQAFYDHPSYEPPYPSPQSNQGYSLLNRLNLDMDIDNLFNTQEYYAGQGSGHDNYAGQGSGQGSGGNQEFYTGQDYSMGQGSAYGSAPIEDDSPVEEVATPVKDISDRKITWAAWDKILASKKNGGLGVSSFFALNRALLLKWVVVSSLKMVLFGIELFKLCPPYNSQQAFYDRPSYEPPSPSPQSNQGYSFLNRLNLDMDIENLFNTQEYYAGQDYSMGQGLAHGSAPIEDDSPVEEVATAVKAKKVSKRRQKTVPTENKKSSKPWTTEEEVALCQAWCDMSENSITGNNMKNWGFWLKAIEYFEIETGSNRGYDAILSKWKKKSSS